MTSNKNILMTRAFNQGGVIVSIDNVKRGRACLCSCITCGAPLIAKKGKEKRHHFAHETDCVCGWSGETELHLLAKEVLQIDKEISFTQPSFDEIIHPIHVPFISIEVEKKLAHLTPDIIGTTSDGEEVIIEICVNHACEENKILYYRQQRENALEIILPPEILHNIQALDLDYVRHSIKSAEIHCISLNPLSNFCKKIVKHNQNIISKQERKYLNIKNELNKAEKRVTELSEQNKQLQEENYDWELAKNDIFQRSQEYRKKLYNDIQAESHVQKYNNEAKYYQGLTEKIKLTYAKAISDAEAALESDKTELRKCFHKQEQYHQKRINDLIDAQNELLANPKLQAIDEIRQQYEARYENRLAELDEKYQRRFTELNRREGELNRQELDLNKKNNRRNSNTYSSNSYKQMRG